MKGTLAAVAAAAAFAFAACGDDPSSVAAGDDGTTASTATASPTRPPVSRRGPMERPVEETTTTTEGEAEAPTPTTAGGPPPVTADPDQCDEAGADPTFPDSAAQAVFVAWTRGDEACAARLMTPAALDELFSRSGAQASDQFIGCFESEEGDPHVDCSFFFEGGATHYLMNFSATDGWTVFDITQFAD